MLSRWEAPKITAVFFLKLCAHPKLASIMGYLQLLGLMLVGLAVIATFQPVVSAALLSYGLSNWLLGLIGSVNIVSGLFVSFAQKYRKKTAGFGRFFSDEITQTAIITTDLANSKEVMPHELPFSAAYKVLG